MYLQVIVVFAGLYYASGGTWMYVVVPGCVWWYLDVCGGTWMCVVVPGCVWWYLDVCGGTWMCVVVPGCVWWYLDTISLFDIRLFQHDKCPTKCATISCCMWCDSGWFMANSISSVILGLKVNLHVLISYDLYWCIILRVNEVLQYVTCQIRLQLRLFINIQGFCGLNKILNLPWGVLKCLVDIYKWIGTSHRSVIHWWDNNTLYIYICDISDSNWLKNNYGHSTIISYMIVTSAIGYNICYGLNQLWILICNSPLVSYITE